MPFSIVRNDIARVHADVLVNAANSHLAAGSGVCGALFAGAGHADMQRACDEIGFCPTGSAATTPGFKLPCRWVVHAVGPIWQGGGHDEEQLLRSCYRSVFAEVERLGAHSVAYPLISSGIYGYPVAEALRVAREETEAFLERAEDVDVTLVVFDRSTIALGAEGLDGLRSYIDDTYVERSPFARRRMQRAGACAPGAAAPSWHCPVCGMLNTADARFCVDCGTPAPDTEGEVLSPLLGVPLPANRAFCAEAAAPSPEPGSMFDGDLSEAIEHLDAPFSTALLALIDARGMTDAEVYKRANISRQLFSKIRSNPGYRPTKPTAVALGLALGLDYDELQGLLARAGLTLSRSSTFDVIVEYFVANGEYNIFRINEALFAYDQPLLGSS